MLAAVHGARGVPVPLIAGCQRPTLSLDASRRELGGWLGRARDQLTWFSSTPPDAAVQPAGHSGSLGRGVARRIAICQATTPHHT